ncbi:MAG: hypothetical protein ABSD20_04860 [Terriglobales bacterium]
MDTTLILLELREQRKRIDQAIAAFEALSGSPAGPRLVSRNTATGRKHPARHITPEGRRRMAEAARQMWIERKRSKPSGDGRFMSAAARRRISLAQKARWAERKALLKAA